MKANSTGFWTFVGISSLVIFLVWYLWFYIITFLTGCGIYFLVQKFNHGDRNGRR